MAMIRIRQKMFGNSGGFRFNASFIDRASMFDESVFRTSLGFAYVWQRLHCICIGYVLFDLTVCTSGEETIACKTVSNVRTGSIFVYLSIYSVP